MAEGHLRTRSRPAKADTTQQEREPRNRQALVVSASWTTVDEPSVAWLELWDRIFHDITIEVRDEAGRGDRGSSA